MKKNFVFALLVVVLGLGFWLMLRHANPPQRQQAPPSEQQTQTSNMEPQNITSPPEETELIRPPGISDMDWKSVQQSRIVMLQVNQPIEFYVRAIDQNGEPVEDVVLTAKLSRLDEEKLKPKNFLHLKMGQEIVHEPLKLTTDKEGWIRFKGRTGQYVFIETLSKEGYVWTQPPTMGALMYEIGGRRNTTVSIEMANAFNPAKGYTFHLWKKGETERVLPIEVGVNMDVEHQGQWVSNYFVSFIPTRVEWTNFNGADLLVQGIRRSSGNADRPYEFTFKLSVPNGGIVLSEDAYAYHAPETGYQTSWSFENQPQKNPPDYPWIKTAYLKLRGGKIYAGVQLGFCNGGFNFSFNGHLNPTGSRNLEPDPEKFITDPEEIRRLDATTKGQ